MSWRVVLTLLVLLILHVPSAQAQQRTIRGQVQDSLTGQPVPGVELTIEGTNIGTLADREGRFALQNAPAGPVTLVTRALGWKSREVEVPAGTDQVTIALSRDYLELERLVVTGRATEIQRQNIANAVTTLTAEEVNETPHATLSGALQGKVSGAVISKNEGTPGGGIQLDLRGPSTISGQSSPLYVVDGVIISNFSIGDNRGALVNGGQGEGEVPRIADINPRDIASIEILKGPSAAAIYGSKAANGVVIIETKRGAAGAPRVTLSSRLGVFDLQNVVPTRRFRTVEDAVAVYGPIAAQEPFATNIRQGRVFANQEVLAGRNAPSWAFSGSVSGGSQSNQYYVAATVKNDEGIIANTGFERQSVMANLSSTVSDRLGVDVHLNFLHTNQLRGLTNNDNNQTSFWMVFPNTPSFVDLSQNANGAWPLNPFVGNGSNPLQTAALLENREEVYRFIASGSGDLRLFEDRSSTVSLRANAGVDFFTQSNRLFSPPEIFFESADGRPGTLLDTDTDNVNLNAGVSGVWQLAPSTSWELTTSAGVQYERTTPSFLRVVSRDLVAGKPVVDAGSIEDVSETRMRVEDFGFYLQEDLLAMDERLYVGASIRFDQSSANSDDEHLFAYPKVAGSYRFPDLGGVLEEIKLRAAFGQTGNQPLFGQEFTNLNITGKLEGLPFLSLEGSFAGDLRPERQTEIEAGVDITAFDGRARLETTGYVQYITDLILQRELHPSAGFSTEFFNGGEMRNVGLEVALEAVPVVSSELRWTTRVDFFLNRNEVTHLPVPPFFTGNFASTFGAFQVKEGQSLTTIIGTAGTDANGNTIIRKLGDAAPKFTFNFVNNVQWKGFDLHLLGEWRYGQSVINLTELLFDFGQNTADYVDTDGTISPVTQCHPDCSGEERIAGFSNGFARGVVQPASFFKLREVALGWELPDEVKSALFGDTFRSVRLSATANNLFKITPYRGMDPEVSQFGITPFRGVDIAPFPPSRSFFFGIDVTL